MTKKQKKNLIRIIVSSVLIVILMFLPVEGWLRFLLFLVPYLLIGYDILIKAVKGVVNLQPFDECFLMSLATVGAMILAVIGDGDYLEAIAVMLFYQVGEWFESYAVGKSRHNIAELMDIRPDYANVETESGIEKKEPDEVGVGTVIIVKPGEKIPIDGIILEGNSMIDTSALTGESVPRTIHEGEDVISGCVNLSGVLKIRTTKEFEDSTVSKILDLVENASSRKSRSEDFITRFARVYTPAVVFSALALAVFPPLINFWFLSGEAHWAKWIYRALTFLVISCPCALVISIPLSFFAGIGGASREGILIKGSNYLEQLSKTGVVVFDKTGTLTKGVFEVTEILPENITKEKLLYMAASAEYYSTHPIAVSLRKAAGDSCTIPSDVSEIAGQGICATVDNDRVLVGNEKLMESNYISYKPSDICGTVLYTARNGIFTGIVVISDVIKSDAEKALCVLKGAGVRKTVMLTGDGKAVAEQVSSKIGIDEVYSELLPENKVEIIEKIISTKKQKEVVAFVGDGINDAPVLTRADIGIAMGAMGSDAAIEASDIVLMDDDPMKISKAVKISRKCLRIVKENIWFSIGVKVICLILGALGIANMWAAIFADVGVMMIAVINSIRALMVKNL